MNFQQLRYILTIYEEGSISKAAQKLFISQPALSHHLIKLETELGIQIFDRTTTPLSLTYVGTKYIEFIQKVLYEENQISKMIEDISTMNIGKLVIGIPSNRSLQILPRVLPGFTVKYPGIQLQVKEFRSAVLETMILNNEIDLACMVPQSSSPLITFTPLFNENVLLAVPRDNPVNEILRGKNSANPILFQNYPFILIKEGHRLRYISDDVFEQHHIQPRCILETSNVDLAIRLSASGLGISFVTSLAASSFQDSVTPVYYELSPRPVHYKLGIQYHANKHVSKTMTLFMKWVSETLLRIQEGGALGDLRSNRAPEDI
ncbi:MAG: LysR family transcriptional regulator [Clostridium sp.]|nr:LysR family transcriptional regulator [Enterocloster asparagiformis]MCD7908515.1 LysR family transcriptional regulator [Clostridium sp.]